MFLEGFNKIFWGLILIIFNINIGPIDILPNFIGYILIYSGINTILNNFNDEKLDSVKILAVILSAWSFIGVFIPTSESISMLIGFIVSILKLILCYNILSGAAKIYTEQGRVENSENILNSQRTYTIMSVISLLGIMILIFLSDTLAAIMTIYALIVEIYYITIVNRIRKTIDTINI